MDAKYLEITLDEKLMWHIHFEVTDGNDKSAINGVQQNLRDVMILSTKNTAPDVHNDCETHHYIRRHHWSMRTGLSNVKKTFARVQRLACKCTEEGTKSCPLAAMDVLLNLTTLHLHNMLDETE